MLPPRARHPGPQPLGRAGLAALEAQKAKEREEAALALAQQNQALATAPQADEPPPLAKVSPPKINYDLAKGKQAVYEKKMFRGQAGEYAVVDMDRVPKPTGEKPEPNRPHDWGDIGGQPDWLNGGLDNKRTCRVCGVSDVSKALIRPDRKGMGYHYEDAFGNKITSMIELSCPTFLGDTNGAVLEAKQRVRTLDSQMDVVNARLNALEAENEVLREQLAQKIELDVTNLVSWLSQMANLHAQAQLPTTQVEVAGLPYEVPAPVADLVTSIAVVNVSDEEDEG